MTDKTHRKERIGLVVSDKMHKTVVVRVGRTARHKKYGRMFKRSNKFKAHDEKNIARIGDLVRIQETRPISKDKRWRLVEIIKKSTETVPQKL